ncbi:JDVT-CTERM system glutamic-type intramembrane protease MrtJ [Xylophilus sp. GOD-11R]|uniref:JDVT-CTERM system glutamic-type intramembrane protease MrtJ n=1 Tax=Xylophilus sp. GOD-11R TaxID=3089814 RepID=UPI00298C4733|nr:JDVT-CTERM system glutamic-type intramembrane protease [Xylophilus sp. GOD-11R]WPB57353.1 JDVT-CTERM system glutamic-type intramembrane protease [Xylophilus sp. GOD-11R]
MAGRAGRVLPLVLLGGPLGAWALQAGERAGLLRLGADGAWPAVFMLLMAAPVVEEYVFRELLQGWLASVFRRGDLACDRLLSPANAVTSLVFCACHAIHQPLLFALAIVLPSLVFGRVREVFGEVWPCMVAHAWFNACFLFVLVA